ncbi:hypothetical protein B0H17DRAFT_1064663 [Mycena rosella]|uniref:Secreted protein n=1 Tax=Mycena rosella TaxID=1033263 RepID=A0AAD7DFW0_MYCRO|nr:hypothetical protein B0H17DRAFT_1064663 [Mycena rosella]
MKFLLTSLSLLHLLCCSHNILGFRDLICVLFRVSFHVPSFYLPFHLHSFVLNIFFTAANISCGHRWKSQLTMMRGCSLEHTFLLSILLLEAFAHRTMPPQVYPISHLFQGQSNGGTKKNARVRFLIPLMPQCARRSKPRGRDIVISIYHFFNPTLGPGGGTIFDSFNATVCLDSGGGTQTPRHSN